MTNDYSGQYLQGRSFAFHDLTGADFSGADLQGATFWKANLTNANLSGADLTEADLTSAILWRTDMDDVKGLDTVKRLVK